MKIYLSYAHMGSNTPVEIDETKVKKTGRVMVDFFGRRMEDVELSETFFFRKLNGHDIFTNTGQIIS